MAYLNLEKQLEIPNTELENASSLEIKKNTGKKRRIWYEYESDYIESKSVTNHEQIGNKSVTNHEQIGNKSVTNHEQIGNNKSETGNKSVTQSVTKSVTRLAANYHFSSLVGLQRAIIVFIYNECQVARSKITSALTLEYISKKINSSAGCVKTTLRRLEEKEFIRRIEYKCGRGGWSKYLMPDHHFQEILQNEIDNKSVTNREQIGNKSVTKSVTQPVTISASSSSIYINKTTTTSDLQISPECESLEFNDLTSIGFTQAHLQQIISQNKLSAKLVQESINAFSFDLIENDKAKTIKGDPLNFFMGILRNGKPYLPPSNYESSEDKAMRLFAERQNEIQQKRERIEEKAVDAAFTNWFVELSAEDKINLLPEMLRKNTSVEKIGKNKILESSAKNHFKNEIWPEMKKNIF